MSRAVWSVNPSLPLASVRTLEAVVSASTARTSFTLVILAIAGAMALLLGVAGIYGVISYSVSQRTREIGIRMALGAARADVQRMVVGQALRLTLLGIGLGLALAFVLTRFMQSLLFGIRPDDPPTFVGVTLILALSSAAAAWLPTARAVRVDPVVALRHE